MPTLYKSNGEILQINRKHPFTLAELQEYVGGYIELVQVGDKYLVVNEEGRLMGLPINEYASKLVAQFGYPFIVGDALLTEKRFVK